MQLARTRREARLAAAESISAKRLAAKNARAVLAARAAARVAKREAAAQAIVDAKQAKQDTQEARLLMRKKIRLAQQRLRYAKREVVKPVDIVRPEFDPRKLVWVEQYGQWTVTRSDASRGEEMVLGRCSCGARKMVPIYRLRVGYRPICGCEGGNVAAELRGELPLLEDHGDWPDTESARALLAEQELWRQSVLG